MAQVIMYGTTWCPYCVRARRLFERRGIDYQDIRVEREPALRHRMMELSGRRTVPQIWIGDTHVGGYTDLLDLDQDGGLDGLLQAAG